MTQHRLADYLNFAATVLVLVVGAYALRDLMQTKTPPRARARELRLPKDPVPLDGMSTKGSAASKVAMIEFSDFECLYCRKFAVETLPLLEEQYFRTGKVLFGFRNYPESNGHPRSLPLARFAACAGRTGKFWEAHEVLFANPYGDLKRAAESIGVPDVELADCLTTIDAQSLDEDRRLGIRLQVQATPMFFVGTVTPEREVVVSELIVGAQPLDVFQRALDRLAK